MATRRIAAWLTRPWPRPRRAPETAAVVRTARLAAAAAVVVVAALVGVAACSPGARHATPDQTRGGAAAPGDDSAAVAPAETLSAATWPANSAERAYFAEQIAEKRRTDHVFAMRLGSQMLVRKIAYPGPDDLTIPAYLFAPKDTTARRPTILFVHGGVHGDFGVAHLRQVQALVRRGYVVVAPEYRGSSGYGPRFLAAIDYGGKEVDDVLAARDYLARFAPYADLSRLAVMGYSHGGFIALHAVMRHPELFRAAVAHVPVADLPTRMRTHPGAYTEIFAAQPGFGGTLDDNPRPYVERSPTAHARELRTPVLVHTADNDEDVFIVENHILRDSMIAAGMDRNGRYTYKEWHAPPGGHSFGVLDTPEGRQSWAETMAFLARHLTAAP